MESYYSQHMFCFLSFRSRPFTGNDTLGTQHILRVCQFCMIASKEKIQKQITDALASNNNPENLPITLIFTCIWLTRLHTYIHINPSALRISLDILSAFRLILSWMKNRNNTCASILKAGAWKWQYNLFSHPAHSILCKTQTQLCPNPNLTGYKLPSCSKSSSSSSCVVSGSPAITVVSSAAGWIDWKSVCWNKLRGSDISDQFLATLFQGETTFVLPCLLLKPQIWVATTEY